MWEETKVKGSGVDSWGKGIGEGEMRDGKQGKGEEEERKGVPKSNSWYKPLSYQRTHLF